jgi:hypothetical protein
VASKGQLQPQAKCGIAMEVRADVRARPRAPIQVKAAGEACSTHSQALSMGGGLLVVVVGLQGVRVHTLPLAHKFVRASSAPGWRWSGMSSATVSPPVKCFASNRLLVRCTSVHSVEQPHKPQHTLHVSLLQPTNGPANGSQTPSRPHCVLQSPQHPTGCCLQAKNCLPKQWSECTQTQHG